MAYIDLFTQKSEDQSRSEIGNAEALGEGRLWARQDRHGACRREREGAGRNKWVRREMGRKGNNRISLARAIPSKKVTGREWGK